MDGLAGKRALVTGGGSGIGRSIALKLAREGCDIALFDIDEAAANAVAGEVRALGRQAAAANGDVSKPDFVRAALAKLAGAPIDILVNNAGIARLGSLLTMPEKDWHEIFAVNVDGVFNVSRAVVPGMVQRRRGRRGEPGVLARPALPCRRSARMQQRSSPWSPSRRRWPSRWRHPGCASTRCVPG